MFKSLAAVVESRIECGEEEFEEAPISIFGAHVVYQSIKHQKLCLYLDFQPRLPMVGKPIWFSTTSKSDVVKRYGGLIHLMNHEKVH
ncbi:hypothetical protein PRIPAC_82963 [Pristionchus pacificus]|uniref:Uncharacterized protein n=1 Tax=Pristionchus pacificus TaxID=54126 RepID=A0A2A6CM79_PRIPA|nr:hypothetical protein PRIPAC_82963 [Pristionchus pacificus]|eukprot:PDM79131.1 hypothetical protein PRIPAC_31710 [Pristionchus pacificus]